MHVFLTGGSGYIGSAVARRLLGGGHRVRALARDERAAVAVARLGAEPLRGGLYDAPLLGRAAREADAVVHAASTNGPDAAEADAAATRALLGGLAGSGKAFVYTSGCWLLGDTGPGCADESSPLRPPPLVAWRVALEREIAAAAGAGPLRAVLLRPAVVYGRGGGLLAGLVRGGAEGGFVRYVGAPTTRWSFVHVDDLADLYARALEAAAPGADVVLGAADVTLTLDELARAAARAAGVAGAYGPWPIDEARAAMGPFADALALDQHVTGAKARARYGWAPASPSPLDDLVRGSYASSPAGAEGGR